MMDRIAKEPINKQGTSKYVVARHGLCPHARVMEL